MIYSMPLSRYDEIVRYFDLSPRALMRYQLTLLQCEKIMRVYRDVLGVLTSPKADVLPTSASL